jgi:stage III sporulation protein AB
MLLKMMGTVLVIGGLGFYGVSRASSSDRRVAQLNHLRLSLNFLAKEITCTNTPLTRALANTALFTEGPVGSLFRETADQLSQRDMTAREAWNVGIKQLLHCSDLKKNDCDLLKSAGFQLGMSDTLEQGKFLNLLQEQIAVQIEKARLEAHTARRIWTYAGFLAGAMIVLLLI